MQHSYSKLIHPLGQKFPATVVFPISGFARSLLNTLKPVLISLSLVIALIGPLAMAPQVLAEGDADTQDDAVDSRRSPLPTELDQMIALDEALNSDEVVWQGEDDQRFLSLFRPAIRPIQMAIILLPDSPDKISKNNLMRQLYFDLPERGWSTMSIILPPVVIDTPAPKIFLPRATKLNSTSADTADENSSSSSTPSAESSDSDEPIEEDEDNDNPLDKAANQRIEISSRFLRDKGARSVTYIAENNSAHRALNASINNKDSTSGLVLWRVDLNHLPIERLKTLVESRITLLDIADQTMTPKQKAARKRHFQMAGFTDDYRLIQVPVEAAGIPYASRRIRQWLETEFTR